MLRYFADGAPEPGETIEVGDVRAVVESVMERPGEVLLECRRAD